MRRRGFAAVLFMGVLLQIATSGQVAAGTVVERTAPYDAGWACGRSYWGFQTPPRTHVQCKAVPPPRLEMPNRIWLGAEAAREGKLLIDTSPSIVVPLYGLHESIFESGLIVDVSPVTTAGVLDVQVDLDAADLPVLESTGFRLCANIRRWNTVVGQDCLGGYDTFRDLAASAPIDSDGEFKIFVFLSDPYGVHYAAATVSRVTYAIN